MESLSHSRPPNRSGKRICNTNNNVNVVSKSGSIYDDVFGGPPKFGAPSSTLSPRMEDYAEIFGSFHAARASSIPVLDLPAVEESEVCFDVDSGSGFDYSEVFGGFEGLDFVVSFDELVNQSCNGGYDGSSEEAWTPADSESLSGESERSVQNQCSSNGASYVPYDGTTEFNISYHKTNVRKSGEMADGMTCVTKIHDVPGFTYVVDEESRLRKVEAETPLFQGGNDGHLNMDFDGGRRIGKQLRKSMSQPARSNPGRETIANDLKTQRGSSKSGSRPNETFVTISEISLKTKPSDVPPPSRPPPALDVGRGNSKTSNNGAIHSEATAGKTSPPYFDVEVDSNSSAAASAAAMKEAMEKAQARLKTAKELMERKKDGAQCRTKSGSIDVVKCKEGKTGKVLDQPCSSKDEIQQGACSIQDSRDKYSVKGENQTPLGKAEATSDLRQEGFYDLVCKSGDEKLSKKSCSSQGSDDIDGAGEWKEETQFFELVKTDKPRKGVEQTDSLKSVAQDTNDYELGQKKKTVATRTSEQVEGTNVEVNAISNDHDREKKEKKLREVKEAYERVDNNGKVKITKEEHKKTVEKVKVATRVSESEENDEKLRTSQQYANSERKLTGCDPADNLVETQLKDKATEVELTTKHRKKEKKHVNASKRMEHEMKHESCKQDHDKGRQRKVSVPEGNVKKHREDPQHKENAKEQRDACEIDESNKSSSEALEVENDEKQKQDNQQENGEKRLSGTIQQEDNKKKQESAFERPENEKRTAEHFIREECIENVTETLDREEEKRRKGSCEHNYGVSEKALKSEQSEATSGKNYLQVDLEQTSEKGLRITDVEKEFARENGVCEHADGESSRHLANEISEQVQMGNVRVPNDMNKLGDKQKFDAYQSAHENDKNEEQKADLEASLSKVHGRESTELKDEKTLEEANVVDEELKTSRLAKDESENKCSQRRVNDTTVLRTQDVKKAGNDGVDSGPASAKKVNNVAKVDSIPENDARKVAHEREERGKSHTHVQVDLNDGDRKDKFTSTQVLKEPAGTERKKEGAPPATSLGRRNYQKPSQQVYSSHNSDRREKRFNETIASEEGETERVKRERELEEERLRKIEEEREREREREKDRMALDKETLEIRDKASFDRMIAEARQRTMTEARERLERACAEAREKNLTDKALMEARLRAERAAVERATAEARARAAEKAMSERAAFGARGQMERSVSDKFSASSRTSGMGQSSSYSDSWDQQFRSASFSSNTRYQYSSAYSEKSEGVEGESPQRCKARLERHRRTAERAAKALAEKNMRDLIAQREQAERTRLAETLDAEVKRWSSGKEGNLRALLSTLQYILGPGSGWQPIPLTEVITSAAVKRAYRKATLCVHPDKLQQRGASIQHKYICEKVFDLLKEAWTKFNSEER